MKNDFPRILALLRKEKGMSQKAAAAKFGISQALLSHYENGIRECGLDFILTVADEYNVSVDYLLGRTSDRQGAVINADELPEYDGADDKNFKGSIVATLNKKLIINSVSIIYDILQSSTKYKDFTAETGAYLSLAIYKVFRMLYSCNDENPSAMFAIRDSLSDGLCDAAMQVSRAYMSALCSGEQIGDFKPMPREESPRLSPEIISQNYPQQAATFFNLISAAEARMGAKPKK